LVYNTGFLPLATTASLPVVAPSNAPLAAGTTESPENDRHISGTVAPESVPRTIESGEEVFIRSAPDLSGVGSPGRSAVRMAGNGVEHWFGDGFDVVVPPPPPELARQSRISRMMEGNPIDRVQPEYPALAKLARIQGTVVLRAVISKHGTIEDLQPVSGPPLLVRAAVDAVKRWRYRPYLLNRWKWIPKSQ
jgi:protein TonB